MSLEPGQNSFAAPDDPDRDPITASRYTLEVEEVAWSRDDLPATIQVIQGGGTRGDTVYENHGDPVLRLGERYLVPLVRWEGTPYYTMVHPWGRFIVDGDDTLRMHDRETWGNLPIAELDGLPLDEALEAVRAAAEQVDGP